MLRVDLLGPLEVHVDGRDVVLPPGRLRALLTELALADGPISADLLAERLWGDEQPGDPGNALQSLVSRLRRALGAPVTSDASGYRLPDVQVDALAFRSLVSSGSLREALALWRGPAEVPEEFERLRLDATERLAEQVAAPEVVALLEPLADQHPLREHLQALLLSGLAGVGRQAEALRRYDALRRRLVDELGADPSPELQGLHAQLLAGPTVRTNLRTALSSFVGRERESAELAELLGGSRLVTLVGAGGSGKTRLATEVAARCRAAGGDLVRDGVWLVELAPLRDPAQLSQAVLAALDLRPAHLLGGGGARDAVAQLAGSRCLIVLDNCEHLVTAVAAFAEDLLGGCPGVRLLTTSREPLALTGESLYPLAPLETAGPAVELFVNRARAASPSFRLDDSTLPAVQEICVRLDGLPLALELAAARLRTLSVQQVAARLDDRFRLLTGGSRTAVSRHRTLSAVVAWSFDLLTDRERELAEGLAVFAGGMTPTSAGAVLELEDPLEGLTSLADKSLLQPVAGDEPRWRMLETLREFALDRLASRGVLDDLRRRHAAWFAGLAVECSVHLSTREQLDWAARLEAEHDDLVAALTFAAATGDAGTALKVTAAAGWWWNLAGSQTESLAWHDLALAAEGDADPRDRARTRVLRQQLLSEAGQAVDDGAQAVHDALLAAGNDDTLSKAMLPMLSLFAGHDERGRAEAEAAKDDADPWVGATACLLLAVHAENHGDLEAARTQLTEAVARFRPLGERWGLATSLTSLADVRLRDGAADDAFALYDEAEQLLLELHAWEDLAQLHLRQARALTDAGERGRARRALERARELSARHPGGVTDLWSELVALDLAAADGALAEARQHLQRAQAMGLSHPPQLVAMVAGAEAGLLVREGELDRARELLLEALDLARPSSDGPLLAVLALATADLQLRRGDRGGASQAYGLAGCLRGGPDLSGGDNLRLLAELGDPEVPELDQAGAVAALAQVLRR